MIEWTFAAIGCVAIAMVAAGAFIVKSDDDRKEPPRVISDR
jgi:hypothetical protein